MPPFAAGQVWQYRARPQDDGSRLVVLKVEHDANLGTIVHVAVLGLRLQNPRSQSGVSDTIGHLPFNEEAVRGSVLHLDGFLTEVLDLEGYRTWREAFERNEAGIFSISVREAVIGMEAALNDQLHSMS
ncbi:hypothetical protein [Deinococcus peraridilitoris]|uniref:PemK-like protein n=1 Tax=Deinococcus peraridilitoris (strain DSM 19664 / LMG 22246 / CIP 109416 / KR-200) TaxID=937777 RepID=L0A3B0_DEIPD|nr:hypothetical protein [Deinococcus peraridilitoris]AFZ67929.1 hypothetical protein Deipe_2457 [Deinococcus peraridilitoris DSM 19664]